MATPVEPLTGLTVEEAGGPDGFSALAEADVTGGTVLGEPGSGSAELVVAPDGLTTVEPGLLTEVPLEVLRMVELAVRFAVLTLSAAVLAMPLTAAVEPTGTVEPAVGLLVASVRTWLGAVELLDAGPVEPVAEFVALTELWDELVSAVAC